MEPKAIGLRIRKLRDAHHVTPESLAKACEVHKESVRLWEHGRALTLDNITRIARFFAEHFKERDVEHYLLFDERRGEREPKGIPPAALRPHVEQLKARLVSLEALCGPAVSSHRVRAHGFSAKSKRKSKEPHTVD